LIKTDWFVVDKNNRVSSKVTEDLILAFSEEVFVNPDHRYSPCRQEGDPNRPGHSSSEVGAEDSNHGRGSKPQSQKETIPKDDPSKRSEIDLSRASQGMDLGGIGVKGKAEDEKEVISVQSPGEATFEAETKPVEKSPPREESKVGSPKKRRLSPRKANAKKTSWAGLDAKGKSKGGRVPRKTSPRVSRPYPKQVIVSKGVAYLEGNVIRMVGGTKPQPGDEVKIGEKEFILKARERKRKFPYLFVFILIAIAMLVSSQLLKGRSSGKLIGVVLEEESKALLSDAEVRIKELGEEVKSNGLGFFFFDKVPSGSYTLQTTLRGYPPIEDKVTITKKQSTTVTVSLPARHLARLADGSSEEAVSAAGMSPGDKGQDRFGAIRIESNVSDPAVMVDDWKLGTGNKVYQGIYIGKHTVRITKEGYQDFVQQVKVESGETIGLRINLSQAGQGPPVPQTSEGWMALAQSQADSSDLSAAVNSYSQALAMAPKSPEAFLGRGLVYIQLDERPKAAQDLSKAAERFSRVGDYNKAIICYSNLLGLDDQDLESFYNRGFCRLTLGQYQRSISDFERTIELDKDFFSGYLGLGKVYYKLRDYELSVKYYKKAKKIDPASPQVYVGLAKAYLAKGKESSAKKNRKKFEELATYMDRERMKQDPEWRELLKAIGEKSD
jgi:Tfp pilus assembly protein PilF